ncbi:sodium-dependent nutrient amino acid transporter 1-like [Ochlerotatus camptorhynchus]|uniref:sodium-dependent nutrient amino acid transporter 1-like n=1 Tax=Ochlerotatus camptorhynchus TaxID=644619 RepID=UPI0031D91569
MGKYTEEESIHNSTTEIPSTPNSGVTPSSESQGVHENEKNVVNYDTAKDGVAVDPDGQPREKWGKKIEFLLSCIALSVGFGNVWRFPYTALQNGGGAFVIPYLIVLFVVGRPLYYLEMVVGQFSSRGCIKVFDLCPLMRGVGVGQTITLFTIVGYYAALLSLAVRYFVDSFRAPLPWSECQREWTDCVGSSFIGQIHSDERNGSVVPSAELYFTKTIMNMLPNIDNGIGVPDWKLVICLLVCWIAITSLLIKGIKSSGKASYFLAIFPYVILFILLVRACTLTGALDGLKYFVTPQWGKLLEPTVWYAAVSQCFFSLTIGLGAVIVFSSFNSFSSNIYRDAMIISWLDTFTSLISGVIVFGVVGNLAHVTKRDVSEVMKAGPQLVFVIYPDAIAKMDFVPNLFAVMFFLMFILLGLGTNMGVVTAIMTSIRDRYPHVQTWKAAVGIAVAGFSYGLVFITPGGLNVLDVIDYYGVTFPTLTLIILEVITFCWIYGVNRICVDIKFMLGIKTGIFWRVCWGFLTLFIIVAIFILEASRYKLMEVPMGYNVFGWCLYSFTVLQTVGWGFYAIYRQSGMHGAQKIVQSLKPTPDWGPESVNLRKDYYSELEKYQNSTCENQTPMLRVYRRIFE